MPLLAARSEPSTDLPITEDLASMIRMKMRCTAVGKPVEVQAHPAILFVFRNYSGGNFFEASKKNMVGQFSTRVHHVDGPVLVTTSLVCCLLPRLCRVAIGCTGSGVTRLTVTAQPETAGSKPSTGFAMHHWTQ